MTVTYDGPIPNNSEPGHWEFVDDVITDNPATIDNSGTPNQACQINISFTGSGTRGKPNGPGTVLLQGTGPAYGIGFTVSISGLSGPINIVSQASQRQPKTAWNIEQYVADFNKNNGEVGRQDERAELEQLYRAHPVVGKTTVEWWDHPGTALAFADQYFTKRNFYIKAYRADKHCEISFHLTFRLFYKRPQEVGWGKGMYR